MRAVVTVILFAHLVLLAGCVSSERVYGNLYEGLKLREAIVDPSVEQKPAGQYISYQGYEAERKKLLENNGNQ